MLEALTHRLVQQVARADALEHNGELKAAGRHAAADPGNVPARVPRGENLSAAPLDTSWLVK